MSEWIDIAQRRERRGLSRKILMSSDLTFGHVVAEKRKKLNLRQKELATKIIREDGVPISPQYLNDIERDRRAPTSDHMVGQFALVLDLNADYLHYLNGRFPEDVRKDRLTENEFSERMVAFRRDTKPRLQLLPSLKTGASHRESFDD